MPRDWLFESVVPYAGRGCVEEGLRLTGCGLLANGKFCDAPDKDCVAAVVLKLRCCDEAPSGKPALGRGRSDVKVRLTPYGVRLSQLCIEKEPSTKEPEPLFPSISSTRADTGRCAASRQLELSLVVARDTKVFGSPPLPQMLAGFAVHAMIQCFS